MIASKNIRENKEGNFVSKDGRIFRPYYGDLLKAMPQDIVKELARRRLEEIAESQITAKNKPAKK